MSCGKCNTCGKWMEPCPRCKGKGVYNGYSCKHCKGIGCICPKHGGYTGSSGSGCFVTTATLLATGKTDDCTELTAFRSFRDNWLMMQSEGKETIAEYYRVAPRIVAGIENADNSKEIYRTIWENDLQVCYQHIVDQEYQEARSLYTRLISRLKVTYLRSEDGMSK